MRDTKTRKANVLAALGLQADMWLSTADPSGRSHLIPVSAWWDGTRQVGGGWFFFRLQPNRIQAYRGYDELEGRDVMRGSRWLA